MNAVDRTVLFVAFQFPPFAGSSAVQRIISFCRYLPRHGWRPIVLTASASAYESTSHAVGNEVPQDVQVVRVPCLDAARHLSILGRYPQALALPDRWISWRILAEGVAVRLIRKYRPSAMLTTFPIATAHVIGNRVACKTGIPWIAEFRDPMWQGDYPENPAVNRSWLELERNVFQTASRVVVTTPSAGRLYAERYPAFGAHRIVEIPNGFDEGVFQRAAAMPASAGLPARHVVPVLLHSGLIYPSERDPTCFFAALASLKRQSRVSASDIQVILRATGNDAELGRKIQEHGISDLVRLEPAIGYLAAIEEMMSADGLLILQGESCDAQIPAKLYEYIRARRPIIALTGMSGDTAETLRRAGVGIVAPLDSQSGIEEALMNFLSYRGDGAAPVLDDSSVESYSRRHHAGALARLLDSIGAQ